MLDAANTKTLIIAVTVLVVAAIIYLIVKQNTTPYKPDEQEKVMCGSVPIFRYIHPMDAFPMVTNEFHTAVAFTSSVLGKLADSAQANHLDVNTKNQIIQLQQSMDQENILFSTGLRSYFMNVNQAPCDSALRAKYAAYTTEMSNRMISLRQAIAQITSITQKGTAVDSMKLRPANSEKSDSELIAEKKQSLPGFELSHDTGEINKSILQFNEILKTNRVNRSALDGNKLQQKTN